jgi:ATP-dependent DNA helicase RecG
MSDYSALQLFDLLNHQDECSWIEAKEGRESSSAMMETVCSFSNEPGLGGGYILLGVSEVMDSLFTQYKTISHTNLDKIQRDFASQCSSMFNIPIRPKVTVETIGNDSVIKIHVEELPTAKKPLYFKSDGLPKGAYRRIGSTDQSCTEDDLHVFYASSESYDQTPIAGSSVDDIDDAALNRYRSLREKSNPMAEELSYDDKELLESLGCLNKYNRNELNLSGLILFGSSKALRSYYPMLRVDYIRVPGNTWVQDPDDRFTTIDMRGPLLTVIFRLIEAINADLPKGFLLPDDGVQASSTGLPTKVLREAIVNAVMHRSYREHRPIQIIRYDNRIEILNPGYSLKAEDRLGEPGSETRNPFIAAVFHETNLAETKGSGIRAMRKLMQQADLAPPTFDSDRGSNQFVTRLLLHHFLGERDLRWLASFSAYEMSDSQKQALIFVREVGAIDNQTYRQMADCDTLRASAELRALKSFKLLSSKGKSKATYYVAGELLLSTPQNSYASSSDSVGPSAEFKGPTPPHLNTSPEDLSAPLDEISAPPDKISTPPQRLLDRINNLKKREHDSQKVKDIIRELCELKPMKASEIAGLFGRGEDYVKRKYLSIMIKDGELNYTYPDMTNHPDQAYRVPNA